MDILIDRPIGNQPGELSSAEVKRQLAKAAGVPIVVRIHSEGGSVFEGLAIYDALKAYAGPKRCIVESAAFSMASAVAMAFNDRQISPNGYMMAHGPYMEGGDAPPLLESLKNKLAEIYTAATKRPRQFINKLMSNETFLDATECLRSGFVTEINQGSPRAVAMLHDMTHRHPRFRAVIVARLRPQATAKARWSQAVSCSMASGLGRTRAIISVDKLHPGLRQRMIDEVNGR